MISKYALILARGFADKGIYKQEEINIYYYGFELLISTVLNLLGIFVVSVLMSVVSGAVLFCSAFIPLRLASGGYHAKHHWSCILGFNILFMIFALIQRFLPVTLILPYSLFSTMLSALIVWTLAPMEAINKPLKQEHKERQRKRSIFLICINMAITLLVCSLRSLCVLLPFLAFYCSGMLASSISLVMADISKKHAITNNTND